MGGKFGSSLLLNELFFDLHREVEEGEVKGRGIYNQMYSTKD